MRRLMLLRHAKAEPAGGYAADFDRPLAPRGRADAQAIGAFMAKRDLHPDLVLVSPARRTVETWDVVSPFLRKSMVIKERLLYGASGETLLGIVREIPEEHRSALLVGHNPGLEQFANELPASGDKDALQRLRTKFPTAALAIIELEIPAWSETAWQEGRLEGLVTPSELGAGK